MAPKWLDEREERAWRGFHQMRTELVGHLARQLTAECGLSESDYLVLVNVSEAPDQRIRSRDLCRSLGWERSRLSHQVSRMEQRGTIRRAECADDARGFDVVLTRKGRTTIDSAATVHLEAVRHCFADVLTRQQLEQLADITATVCAHLRDAHGDPA